MQTELEDPWADDVPTAVIRSKADLPNWDSHASLSTNDIVVSKLISILGEIRMGGGKKRKDQMQNKIKKEVSKPISKSPAPQESKLNLIKNDDISIYDDIGDYELPQKRTLSYDSADEDDFGKRSSRRHERAGFLNEKRDNFSNNLNKTNADVEKHREPELNFNLMAPPDSDDDDDEQEEGQQRQGVLESERDDQDVEFKDDARNLVKIESNKTRPSCSSSSESEKSDSSSRRSLSLSPTSHRNNRSYSRSRSRSRTRSGNKRSNRSQPHHRNRRDDRYRDDRLKSNRRNRSRSRERRSKSRSNDRRRHRSRSYDSNYRLKRVEDRRGRRK